MSGKRALVVDDSRAARTFLSRLLGEQHLEVDTAETAEQAIDYLTRNRPDVIFMDHQMPGMDGFQAVRIIKANPRTATIPILMFTSQEGELYMSQARALGAMGVLPKAVARTDVSKVLEQLRLTGTGERRAAAGPDTSAAPLGGEPRAETTGAAAPASASATTGATPDLSLASSTSTLPLSIVEELLKDLRADFERGLEQQQVQIRSIVSDAIPPPPPPPPPPVFEEPPRASAAPWVLGVLGLAVGLAFALLWWQQRQQVADLTQQLRTVISASQANPAGSQAIGAASQATAAGGVAGPGGLASPGGQTEFVPFGQTLLSSARAERLRELVNQLSAANFTGQIDVVSHAGRFCLTGSQDAGYGLAADGATFLECSLIASADDPAVGSGSTESLAFANTLAELRKTHAGRILISVRDVPASIPDMPYPSIEGELVSRLTAAEWNAAAQQNNRVDITWRANP
ncbi:MAG: response regulator [Nevskiaceae bacterium]|jgi:CheY-like chemotaxis protein|nr:response regulator [Nevskiaceae bacterium]